MRLAMAFSAPVASSLHPRLSAQEAKDHSRTSQGHGKSPSPSDTTHDEQLIISTVSSFDPQARLGCQED